MGNKNLKYFLNILLIAAIALGTMWFLLKDSNLKLIQYQLQMAGWHYMLGGAVLMLFFVCSESVIMRYLFGYLKQKVKLGSCILLSHIGFFYGAITPGASGGQPLQVFYMTKNGVDPLVGTLTVMIITICYKLALLLLIIAFFFICPGVMFDAIAEVPVLFTIGTICVVVFVGFLIICVFKPVIADKILSTLISIGGRIKILKNPERTLGKAIKSLRQYETATGYLKEHKKMLVLPLILTIFQRLCYFSVPYMVVRAVHVDYSWAAVVGMQLILSMSVDSLPIPGASGASESVFVILFTAVVGSDRVMSAMLLHRGLTYYLLLVVGGIVSLIAHLIFVKKAAIINELKALTAKTRKKKVLYLSRKYIRPEEAEHLFSKPKRLKAGFTHRKKIAKRSRKKR